MNWDAMEEQAAVNRVLRLQYQTEPAMLALFDRAWDVGDEPAIDALSQKHDLVVRAIRSY